MKKPKIAILTLKNSYRYGGVLSSVKVVYNFCLDYFEPTVFFLGFDPDIATSIKRGSLTSSSRSLTYFGMNCVEVGARWAFWEPGHYAYTINHWRTLLQDYDYFFMVSGTSIAAHPLALLDKKFVMWVSTLYNDDRDKRVAQLTGMRKLIDSCAYKRMNAIEKKILNAANLIFPLSSYSAKQLNFVVPGVDRKFVSCGFPITLPDNISENKNEQIVIAVGRFSDPRKNFPMLLRMFEQVHQVNDQARLVVVGKKPLPIEYQDYVDKPCMKNIWFVGQVSDADLKALYQRAKVMVISSYQEGFGIVGVEALSYGIPVIATMCGGTVDYTLDGITGYRVAIDDDETMARYVIELLRNKLLHKQLSLNARDFIKKNYSYPVVYKTFKQGLIAVYPELAKLFKRKKKTLTKNSIQEVGL